MSRQLNEANVEFARQSILVSTKSVQKPIISSSFHLSQQKSAAFKQTSSSRNNARTETSSFDNESKQDYFKKVHERQIERPSQETAGAIPDEEHSGTSTYLNINEDLVNGFNGPKSLENLKSMSVDEQVCRKQLMQHHLSLVETMDLLDLNEDSEIVKQAMDQVFQQNIVQPPSKIEVWVQDAPDAKAEAKPDAKPAEAASPAKPPAANESPKPAEAAKPTDASPAQTGLANKPGEPAFGMKIDLDKLAFKSDKLAEEPVALELKVQNTTNKRQTFKVKCTSNEIFRVRPPLGFIDKDQTAKIKITFQAKEIPEPNKHFFAIYHMGASENPTDKAAQPRSLWTATSKPEGVKRLACSFEKNDGTVWTVEKK